MMEMLPLPDYRLLPARIRAVLPLILSWILTGQYKKIFHSRVLIEYRRTKILLHVSPGPTWDLEIFEIMK